MLGHEWPEAVSPERGVVLTVLQSSILIVNKLLSHTLSIHNGGSRVVPAHGLRKHATVCLTE
jgi:hypothetical protein